MAKPDLAWAGLHWTVCPECGCGKFWIESQHRFITSLHNNIGDYYTIVLVCSKCHAEHEIGLGSD